MALCYRIFWYGSSSVSLVESEGLLSIDILHSIHYFISGLFLSHGNENIVKNVTEIIARKVAQEH